MDRIFTFSVKVLLIFTLISFYSYKVYAEDMQIILEQLQILQKDIKTLEKAVYNQDVKTTFNNEELSSEGSDILTKHLLKLSELEEQFKILTNNFYLFRIYNMKLFGKSLNKCLVILLLFVLFYQSCNFSEGFKTKMGSTIDERMGKGVVLSDGGKAWEMILQSYH